MKLSRQGSSQKKWNQLSPAQKIARTSSTGGNLLVIAAGMVLTGLIAKFFYDEVLAPDSKTNWFNRAVERVKHDPRCLQLLGTKRSIKAYGEPTNSRWARSRPIASTTKMDRYRNEHLLMHFYVEGDAGKGVVQLHLMKRPGDDEYDYKYLFLDVRGQQRVYLENADARPDTPKNEKKGLFGVRWR
ncbi:TIM21-domain-containing protein [Kalaharituber pfeilii]|nr:TIM21-domain-containing protein [Kalaharituber pfeilii]